MTDLAKLMADVRKALDTGATGPTLIAPSVVAVVDKWEDHRAELADFDTPNQWLTKYLGGRTDGKTRGTWVAFFRDRSEAATKMGRIGRDRLHHELLVWVARHVSPEEWGRIKGELQASARLSGGVLSVDAGKRLVAELLGWQPKDHGCKMCAELRARVAMLEQILDANCIPLPENDSVANAAE
jgi:hypothetical protein